MEIKAIKSWYEEYRQNMETGEELAQERQKALDFEAEWRADNERLHQDDQIMHGYANLLMGKELKALGEYIIKKYPSKEDKWLIADAVYYQYGRYYMYKNEAAEAVKWFEKALKNKIPYPYKVWEDLAAAYIEAGDYKKADYWIRRYMKHRREKDLTSHYDMMNYAKFYLDIGQCERALALMLESHENRNWYLYDLPLLARAYFGVGNMDKGFEVYEEYLQKAKTDDFGFAELALSYYNYKGDVERAEALYLKSIEAASNREDVRHWNYQIYDILSIIFANSGIWDKCFHYLRLYFTTKYGAAESDLFCQIIDANNGFKVN